VRRVSFFWDVAPRYSVNGARHFEEI
jgi:hypothetical protein